MRAIGNPLYMNGRLLKTPITISHVPGPAEAQGILGGIGIDPSMGGLGAYATYDITRGVLGADAEPPPPPPLNPEAQPTPPPEPTPPLTTKSVVLSLISLASTVGMVFHGYRRTKSVGWAIGWALFGGLMPIIAWPVAIAQGFGKPKSLTPNRSRRRSPGRRRRARRSSRRRRSR